MLPVTRLKPSLPAASGGDDTSLTHRSLAWRSSALGTDLPIASGTAPSTTARDRKALLRTLIEEVILTVDRANALRRPDSSAGAAVLVSGHLRSALPRRARPTIRTEDDTLDLLRRLAVHYPDDAHRRHPQSPRTDHRPQPALHRLASSAVSAATERPNAPASPSLPPRHRCSTSAKSGKASLGVAPSTVLRWLEDGFIPWRADHPRRALADPTQRRAQPSASPTRFPMASCPSGRPPSGSASRARPCGNVSSGVKLDRRPRPPRPAKKAFTSKH